MSHDARQQSEIAALCRENAALRDERDDLARTLREITTLPEPLAPDLTLYETRILAVMRRHPGRFIRPDQLIEAAHWCEPDRDRPTNSAVRQNVLRIRRKLAAAGSPWAIRNVRSLGYALEPIRDRRDA